MEFVNLGQAGLKVSRLCLGTMVFGAQCDEVQSALVLDAAAELGINFLDTADVYPVPPDLKTAGRTEEIVGEHRLAAISALQPRYNLLFRQPERDLFPFCRAAGIGVMPYNPLGAGMLTGKYQRGQQPPPESRFGWGEYGQMYQGRYWSEEMFSVVGTLMQVAEQEGMTPAQAALAWVLSRDAVTSPIVGASRPEQL